MEDQYIRARALSLEEDASEVIKGVEDEYDWPSIDEADSEVDPEKVSLIDEKEAVLREFTPDEDPGDPDERFDEVKKVGYQMGGLDVGWTEGHEFVVKSGGVKERLHNIEKVNDQLREAGSRRRYVATKANTPDLAYAYEDDFGVFYFKTDDPLRPSDVVEKNGDESWYLYEDDDERVLKTIQALAQEYPEAIQASDSIEALYTFTDRVLKTEDEVVRDDDVISLEQQDAIVSTIAQAKDFSKRNDSTEKATMTDVHRRIDNVRRSLVVAVSDFRDHAPSYVQPNIGTAMNELEDALDYVREESEEGVEISLIQAKDKIGVMATAMEGDAPQDVVDAAENIHDDIMLTLRLLRRV